MFSLLTPLPAEAIRFPGLFSGPPAYRKPPPTRDLSPPEGERPCPAPRTDWQYGRLIAGVELESSDPGRKKPQPEPGRASTEGPPRR